MPLSFLSERLTREAGDPFASVTTDDHSATLWIVILLSTIYAILVLAIRLGFTKRKAYALDDVLITIAYVCT
jgi:hypothetical protein